MVQQILTESISNTNGPANLLHHPTHSEVDLRFRSMILFILVASFAFSASAESLVNKSFLGGVAIKGYDSVGYFEQSKPVKGSDDF